MDNLFQLPCEFQYHLIIPSMLTGLQVVWEAYGTPVAATEKSAQTGYGHTHAPLFSLVRTSSHPYTAHLVIHVLLI